MIDPKASEMTLRDYFAGQVLLGMTLGSENMDGHDIAQYCYHMADLMLKERNKDEK